MKLSQLYTVTYEIPPSSVYTFYLQTLESGYTRVNGYSKLCNVTFSPCLYIDKRDDFYRVYFQGGPESSPVFTGSTYEEACSALEIFANMTPDEFYIGPPFQP